MKLELVVVLALLLLPTATAYELSFHSHSINQTIYERLAGELDRTANLDAVGVTHISVRDSADTQYPCGFAVHGTGFIQINDAAIRQNKCGNLSTVLKHEICHQLMFNTLQTIPFKPAYLGWHELFANACTKNFEDEFRKL